MIETSHLSVEFKLDLKKGFNHTFDRADAIVCWTARVKESDRSVYRAERVLLGDEPDEIRNGLKAGYMRSSTRSIICCFSATPEPYAQRHR